MTKQKRTSVARHALWSKWWDFLGSMRLAISLLSVLAIASAVGTMVKQNEPMINYVNQFGAFWAPWFGALGLYDVYNQPWFLIILLVLLISTSICLIRNTPKMLRDMREFKNHDRTNSLLHMPDHDRWLSTQSEEVLTHQAAEVLAKQGFKVRASQNAAGVYLVAKKGRLNRLGYILTHLAIVVICLGGLMDSELSIRAQVLLFGKVPFSNMASEVPASGILSNKTLSYRGNSSVTEGKSIDYVLLDYDQNRQLVQTLPFVLTLDQFHIDYYSTGMPKRFASDVTVQDKATGEVIKQTIEVNHPLRYKGVAVYQSSFDDGGSKLKLAVYPMSGTVSKPAPINATVYKNQPIAIGGQEYTIEWRQFKPINVEDLNNANPEAAQNIKPLEHALRPTGSDKKFQNLGPMMQFVLRDKAGQGVEYRNYMTPVTLDGEAVILSGVRSNPDEDFKYLRIPVDQDQSVGDFMRLRAALSSEDARAKAVRAYAEHSGTQADQAQFVQAGDKLMTLFAKGGLSQLGQLLERDLSEADREKIANGLTKALTVNLWTLLNQARVADGLKPLEDNEQSQKFIRLLMVSYSDSLVYGSPVFVQLEGFDQVQASVFQMTRSPGQFWVYLGSLMLVLGTLAMIFIRERRLWLHIKPDAQGQQLTLALTSTRRTFDYRNQWQEINTQLKNLG